MLRALQTNQDRGTNSFGPGLRVAGAFLCLVVFLSGCAVHSVDECPRPLLSGARNDEAGFLNAVPAARTVSSCDPWWKSFHDDSLDSVIELSLSRNPDVNAVSQRIAQVAARLVQSGSTLYPRIDGVGEYSRRWRLDGDVDDSAALGLLLNWELDIWGRIRSGQSARAEEYDAAVEDWYAARLFLTSAVAETWFGLVEQHLQLELVREQIELNQTLLRLTKLRFGQGQGSNVDILQQQQQLEATEALVPDFDARVEEFQLALDSLTGSVPGNRPRLTGGKKFPDLPPYPSTGVPSDLLELRPDLRARRARIRALDYEVGEAIANCLPQFSIGGSLLLAGTASPEILVGDAIAGAVGPIFDAGNRRAEVARRKARVREELDLYTAAYLNAIREVETSLMREREISRRLRLQEQQLSTIRKLLAESRARYRRGLNDYLPVLDALSRSQQLERDLLTGQRELLSARVALHRAIGGPLPDPCGLMN